MDLIPVTTHVDLEHLLGFGMLVFLFDMYLFEAWIFSHAMRFMLASNFVHQYHVLGLYFGIPEL